MDIYIYSDESGVFDKVHNDYFIFAGLIFLGKEDKDVNTRKYSNVERSLRTNGKYHRGKELKASYVTNKEKGKLYRSLNSCIKFAAVIRQQQVDNSVYAHKKSKQRYMDYVYKIALKKALEHLIKEGKINPSEVENIYIHCDEHSTATDGRYELREALEQEFKIGTHNFSRMAFYPPIFNKLNSLNLRFYDSKTVYLIRAADVVANKIYHRVLSKEITQSNTEDLTNCNLYVTFFP